MSLALPAIARLYEMADLVTSMLAYELLAGLVALDQRHARAGDGVEAVRAYVRQSIAPLHRDRSPGPDVEQLREILHTELFRYRAESANS